MNRINIPENLFNRVNSDIKYRAELYKSVQLHLNMYINQEYAFENGTVCTKETEAMLFYFEMGAYKGEEKSEQGNMGFVIEHFDNRSQLCKFYFGIHQLSDTNIFDWYVEPLNEYTKKKFDAYDTNQTMFGYACKFLVILDYIQIKSLKQKKKIIKIQSNAERHFKEHTEMNIQSRPIHITDGIYYQYVNEYNDKRPYNRHIEAWEVRGHYRHYKSGKVVYIQPFQKGSGTVNDKRYEILV